MPRVVVLVGYVGTAVHFAQIIPPTGAIQMVHRCAIHTCTSARPLPKCLCKMLVPECPGSHWVCRSRTHTSLDPSLSVFSRDDDRDDNRGAWALRNMYSSTQSITHHCGNTPAHQLGKRLQSGRGSPAIVNVSCQWSWRRHSSSFKPYTCSTRF